MTYATPSTPEALIKLDIEFDGTAKSLAQIATILDKIHLKIVSSFTHRILRGANTRFGVIADTTTSPYGIRELKATLLQIPEVRTITISPLEANRTYICKAPPFYEEAVAGSTTSRQWKTTEERKFL